MKLNYIFNYIKKQYKNFKNFFFNTELYNCIKNFFYNLKSFLFNIRDLYYYFLFFDMQNICFLIKEELKFHINQILIRIAENPTYTMFLFLYLYILFFIY
jgi:hypothetical protein